MRELLLGVLDTLQREQIRYCILRDGHQLDVAANSSDVDLLVDAEHFFRLDSVLAPLGFVRLPAWGHRPHRFFVAYHEPTHGWLKLDAVRTLPFGNPSGPLCRELSAGCLARRRRHGPAFIPSPEDELIALLLHCVLDKRVFTPAQRLRVRQLRHQVDADGHLA